MIEWTNIPFALESERVSLGFCLLEPSRADIVLTRLRPEDFYRKQHGLILKSMMRLRDHGVAIDSAQVIQDLRETGRLDEVDEVYIASLLDPTAIAGCILDHITRVKDTAWKRELIRMLDNSFEAGGSRKEIAGAIVPLLQGCNGDSRIKRMADVHPQSVEWLWYPYIPLGKLTLIEGDPGVGKSTVTLAIATAISRGHGLPTGTETRQGSVLLFSAEDDPHDTVRPRLDVMGADNSRIFTFDALITLDPSGLMELEDAIIECHPVLVIIDPLVAFLGSNVDFHRANETRLIMASLAVIARRRRAAILAVRHLTKGNTAKAIYRGIGSIDLTAACRSVLLAGCDPDDTTRRAIVPIKSNLSKIGPPVGYEIRDGKFFWQSGGCELTAERILGSGCGEDERSALADAEDFLNEVLAEGPRQTDEVTRAAREAGISDRTLRRARERLGVKFRKEGRPGQKKGQRYLWALPHADVDHQGEHGQDQPSEDK